MGENWQAQIGENKGEGEVCSQNVFGTKDCYMGTHEILLVFVCLFVLC